MNQQATSIQLPPLRHDGPTPLWLQLKHALRDYITFQLVPGARIPSESILCDYYGLSRMTVRQAITALVNEGLVGRQQGRGSFVLPTPLAIPPNYDAHFLDDGFDASDGQKIQIEVVSLEPQPRWIRMRLGLGEDERAHKLRLALDGDDGVIVSRTIYVPERFAPSLADIELRQPIHRILENQFDMEPAFAEETMRLIYADQLRAELLRTSVGQPLILVERVVFLENREPLEYSRTYYRAERYRFEHKLVRPVGDKDIDIAQSGRRHLVAEDQSAHPVVGDIPEHEPASGNDNVTSLHSS